MPAWTDKNDGDRGENAGEAERETWFGLVKIPEQKARVYYRDLYNWKQENTVYTMEYGR